MGYRVCEIRKRRYFTMYIKVLYNIKDNKKIRGKGEGQYLNPKHSQVIKKKD